MTRMLIGIFFSATLVMGGCDDSEPTDPCLGVSCDDGVDCTVDECDATTGDCQYTPDDSLCQATEACDAEQGCLPLPCENDGECDDGVFCNGTEACDAVLGTCQAGAAPCDDGVECTDDSCDEENQICDNTPNDDNCAAGETCDPLDGCLGGGECTEDGDCDDGIFCNGTETCDAGTCLDGSPVVCDDGVDCTADSCDEAAGACQYLPDHGLCSPGEMCDPGQDGCVAASCTEDADCDDGYYCNGTELCETDGCIAGTAVICDDGIDCTADSCSEEETGCLHAPDDTRCPEGEVCDPEQGGCVAAGCGEDADCDDGVFCNGVETCQDGACTAGTPVSCDDAVDCTVDSCDPALDQCISVPDHDQCAIGELCDPALGCVEIPCQSDGDCDDGLYCNGEETCDGSTCQPGTPPDCDDGVGCTQDRCDPASDSCENTPDDGECDDGLYCNGSESCDPADGCQDGIPVVCDDGVDCTDDNCIEDQDACESVPNDANCDNGLFCDGPEFCHASDGCLAGTAPCDDGVDCTDDNCDEETETCSSVGNDDNCDDGLYCNGAETCDPTDGCQPGSLSCDDGIGCTDDSCDEDDDLCLHAENNDLCDDTNPCTLDFCDSNNDPPGCQHALVENGTSCSDDNLCNGEEVCHNGMCRAGFPLICTDDNPCTHNYCLPTAGCMTEPEPDGQPCPDGDLCNGDEICSGGSCTAGTPLDCDDGNPCTDDDCSPQGGCAWFDNADPCDDQDPCTSQDVCLDGSCNGESIELCGDGVDNDCDDEIDENCPADIGTYVAPPPWGDDGNPGTQELPVATVMRGVANAEIIQDLSGEPQHVFVAGDGSHVYSEDFVMLPGISVWGGYSDDGNWTRDPEVYPTYLAPTTALGVQFSDPAIDRQVTLDGFVINGQSTIGINNSSAAITIDGASPTISHNTIQAGDINHCFGVTVSNWGNPLIIANQVDGGLCSNSSRAVFLAGADAQIIHNDIGGGQSPNTLGIDLQDTGWVEVTRNSIWGGTSGAIVGPITGAFSTGLLIHGDLLDGVVVNFNEIVGGNAGGNEASAVGVGLADCHGVITHIEDNLYIQGGIARSAISQGWAVGISASGDCPARIQNNLAILGGEGVTDVGAGVLCQGGAGCVVEDNILIQGALEGHSMNSGAVAIFCDSACDSVSRNHLLYGGRGAAAVGLSIYGTPFATVDRNHIHAGVCSATGDNAAGIGLQLGMTGAEFTNNVVFGGMCQTSFGVVQVNEVDSSGQELHPSVNGNYINAGGTPDSIGRSMGVSFFSEGEVTPPQGDYRNNIVNAGYAMNRTGVLENGPAADPRSFDFNDITGANAAVYFDEGDTPLFSIGQVNALDDIQTGSNILAWPALVNESPFGDLHLTADSPCIDAGTSEGAPDHDLDDEPRPAGAAVDMGADEYQ